MANKYHENEIEAEEELHEKDSPGASKRLKVRKLFLNRNRAFIHISMPS